jgi:hypothetical protein
MILDQITLAGLDAYLRLAGAEGVDISSFAPCSQPGAPSVRAGRSQPLGDGVALQVTALRVLLERDGLFDALRRSPEPLLRVVVDKEVFPGLFADPYAHRVHRIGGFDDFGRGALDNVRVLDVGDVPTLVSTGDSERCRYRSPIVRLPSRTSFRSAAWEIPTSKLSPREGLTYSLDLRIWPPGASPSSSGRVLALAKDAAPAAPRCVAALDDAGDVGMYQIELRAKVTLDTDIDERLPRGEARESIGRPLLSAVHLLEAVPSVLSFHSLQELIDGADDRLLLDEHGGPPRRLMVRLPISAILGKGESIRLEICGEPPPFTYLEARLEATVVSRPPRLDKEA